MEGNDIVEEIALGIMAEAEFNAFEDYKRKIRKGKAEEGMTEYASKMGAMSMTPPSMVGGNWEAALEVPYKSPFGKRGFEYRKSRRVNYEATESGMYEVAGSYGIGRKTSSMDRMITNAVLSFCHGHEVKKVIIIREKI